MNKRVAIVAGAALLLALIGGVAWAGTRKGAVLSRLARIHNPGGLIPGFKPWDGELRPSSDKDFAEFQADAWGCRAMLLNMRARYGRGANTIQRMIAGNYSQPWTPDNQANYVAFVANRCKIGATAYLSWDSPTICTVAAAMASWETGTEIYTPELFLKVWTTFGEVQ